MRPEEQEMEIDLLEILLVLKEKILVLILCAVIGTGLMGAYSFLLATPIYESTAQLYVLSSSTSVTSLADIQLSSSLAKDYEKMVLSRPVINKVKEQMNLDYKYEEIVENMVTVENLPDTRLLNITVHSSDAKEASKMANTIANVSREHISNIMETDAPKLSEAAFVAQDPVSPNKVKNMALGFLAGLIISACVVSALWVMNGKIRTPEDIEKHLGLANLGVIPDEKTASAKDKKKNKKNKKSKK